MKFVLAGRNILLLAVLLAGSLGFVWVSVSGSADRWFNPTPEKTAEEFIAALAAHRYTGARNTLSAELRSNTSLDRLEVLVASIEAKKIGIELVHGETYIQSGDWAVATVRVEMKDGSGKIIQLPLVRENGLWKITGLEEMWSLIITRAPFKLLIS